MKENIEVKQQERLKVRAGGVIRNAMRCHAFASPLVPTRRVAHGAPLRVRRQRFAIAKSLSPVYSLSMSSIPEPERNGSSADDEALNTELQKKVNELFGSRQNISIDVETDSGVQFTVRKNQVRADYDQTKAAWSVITSIAILSIIAGVVFTAMYYSGAIHGSDPTTKRYDMPAYGKSSYVNPYELLEEDRQMQEAQSLPEP